MVTGDQQRHNREGRARAMLCLCCACWSVRPSGVRASCLGFMYLRLLWSDALQSILYRFSLNASILLPVRPCWENEMVLSRQHPVGTGGWRCPCLCSAYGQPPCARGLQAEAGTSLHAFCGLWIPNERTLPRRGSAPCKGFGLLGSFVADFILRHCSWHSYMLNCRDMVRGERLHITCSWKNTLGCLWFLL